MLLGAAFGLPTQYSGAWVLFLVLRFRMGFSIQDSKSLGRIFGFPIQDPGFWVRFLVFRFRIQVFGSSFGFSDSGFSFLGPASGLSIQDSVLWVQAGRLGG